MKRQDRRDDPDRPSWSACGKALRGAARSRTGNPLRAVRVIVVGLALCGTFGGAAEQPRPLVTATEEGELIVDPAQLRRSTDPPIFVHETDRSGGEAGLEILVMAAGDSPYQLALFGVASRWVADHRDRLFELVDGTWLADYERSPERDRVSRTQYLNDRLRAWLHAPDRSGSSLADRMRALARQSLERGENADPRGYPGTCPPPARCEVKAVCPWLPGTPWCDCIDVCWDCCAFFAHEADLVAANAGQDRLGATPLAVRFRVLR